MEKEILDEPNPNNSYQDLWDQLEKSVDDTLKKYKIIKEKEIIRKELIHQYSLWIINSIIKEI